MDLEFQTMVERYSASLYRLAYSYLSNRQDAEDVLQEVFLKFLQRRPVFPAEEQCRAWLMTVTANQCRDLLRSPWRRRVGELQEAQGFSAPEAETHPEVAAALRQLAPKDRAVVYLFYYEELPTKEIAAILRMTDSAVRTRLSRAREKLKDLLGGDDHG